MIIPNRTIRRPIPNVEESPFLVKEFQKANRFAEAEKLRQDMVFGQQSGEFWATSFDAGVRGGIANKAFRAGYLALTKAFAEDGDMMSEDDANALYGIEGHLKFSEPIAEDAAIYMRNHKLDELRHGEISSRMLEASKLNYLPMIGGGFLGTMADPGEMYLGLLTGGMAATRYGSLVGSSIQSARRRTIFRGATFGAAEGVIAEPFHHVLSDYLNEEYTFTDTMLNVAFSSGLGTLVSGTRAALGDVDSIKNLSYENVLSIAEEKARQFVEGDSRSRMFYVMTDHNQTVIDLNKDLIDSMVEEAKITRQKDFGLETTAEEEMEIRTDIILQMLPGMKTEAKLQAAKHMAETNKPIPVDTTETGEISYNTESSAEASDETITNVNKQELQDAGVKIEEQAGEAEPEVEVEEGVEAEPKPEEAEAKPVTTKPVVEPNWSKVAVAVINELFPGVKVGMLEPGTDAKGVFDAETGEILISPDNLRSKEDVVATVLEEVIGHKGINFLYKKNKAFKKFLKYVDSQHKDEIDDFERRWSEVYDFRDRGEVIEEFIAKRAATRGALSPGVLRTIGSDVRRMLGVTTDDPTVGMDYIDVALFRGMAKLQSTRIQSVLNRAISRGLYDEQDAKIRADAKFERDLDASQKEITEQLDQQQKDLDKDWDDLEEELAYKDELQEGIKNRRAHYAKLDKEAKAAQKEEFQKKIEAEQKEFQDIQDGIEFRRKLYKARQDEIDLQRKLDEMNETLEKVQEEMAAATETAKVLEARIAANKSSMLIRRRRAEFRAGDFDPDSYETLRDYFATLEAQSDYKLGLEKISRQSTSDYQKLKAEYAKAESRGLVAPEPKKVKSHQKILNKEKNNTKKQVLKQIQDIEADEDLDQYEYQFSGVKTSGRRYSKLTPEESAAQKKRAKKSIQKIKEERIAEILDEVHDAYVNQDYEKMQKSVTLKVNVDGKERTYKLNVSQKLNAMKDANVLSKLLEYASGFDDEERIPAMMAYVEKMIPQAARTIAHKYVKQFHKDLKNLRAEKFFSKRGNIKQLYLAARGGGTEQAQQVFNAMQNMFRGLIREQNLEGGRTAFLDDHVIPRFFSKRKIFEFFGKKKGIWRRIDLGEEETKRIREDFISWYLPKLDLKRMYGEAIPNEVSLRKSLGTMFDAIDDESGGTSGIVNSANIANKSEISRNIHFLTAEDDFQHDQLFGSEDMVAAMYNQVDQIATRTSLLRHLGTNPENMVTKHLIPAMKDMLGNKNIRLKNKVGKMKNKILRDLKIIDQTSVEQETPNINKITSNLRAASNLAKMGGLLFTSSSDVAFRWLQMFNLDIDKGFTSRFFSSFFGGSTFKTPAEKMILENNLAMMEGMTSAFVNRFDPDNLGMSSAMGKIQHQYFNANLMNFWNKWMREGFILGSVKRMGSNASYSMAELEGIESAQIMVQSLKDAGITADDWETIRSAATHISNDGRNFSPAGGRKSDVYLTVDMVQDIPDDVIAKKIGSQDKVAIERFRNELSGKYGAFLAEQMDIAILTPGVREKRIAGLGTVEGSMANSIAKMVMQYKSHPISMMTKVIGRQLKPGMMSGSGVAFLSAAGMAIALQATAMQGREILTGRSARPWDGRLLWDAFVKSGSTGIVADFMRDYEDTDIGDVLFGPGTGMIMDSLGVGSQLVKSATPLTDDTMKDFGMETTKFFKNWTPLNNHPVVKALVTDPVFNSAADFFNPDTLSRLDSWYEKRGQYYWLNSPVGDDRSMTWEELLTGFDY